MKIKFQNVSFEKRVSGSEFPKIKFQKWEKPFPNWNPNTKISYIKLDIIVSKLVFVEKQPAESEPSA